jgi:hypothetical protein
MAAAGDAASAAAEAASAGSKTAAADVMKRTNDYYRKLSKARTRNKSKKGARTATSTSMAPDSGGVQQQQQQQRQQHHQTQRKGAGEAAGCKGRGVSQPVSGNKTKMVVALETNPPPPRAGHMQRSSADATSQDVFALRHYTRVKAKMAAEALAKQTLAHHTYAERMAIAAEAASMVQAQDTTCYPYQMNNSNNNNHTHAYTKKKNSSNQSPSSKRQHHQGHTQHCAKEKEEEEISTSATTKTNTAVNRQRLRRHSSSNQTRHQRPDLHAYVNRRLNGNQLLRNSL